MGPGTYFIHSAALTGIDLSTCSYEPGFNTDKYGTCIHTYILTYILFGHMYIHTYCMLLYSECIIVQLILQVPNNKPLPGHPPIELDQEEYVITDPPPRPPKPDVSI